MANLECGRCLAEDDEPMALLDCGHAIHERCRAHVADEGARCPVNDDCDGSSFMFEDETEMDARVRLRVEYVDRHRTAMRAVLKPEEAQKLAAKLCVVPKCDHGTPFYFDGALHSYTATQEDGNIRVRLFKDGALAYQVLARAYYTSTRGPCVVAGKIHLNASGWVASADSCYACNRDQLEYTNEVEGWTASLNMRKVRIGVCSPFLRQVEDQYKAQLLVNVEKELKPITLAMECLELRLSFHDAGLSHLLQPLPYIPHTRVPPSEVIGKVKQTYSLGSAQIMLLGKTTYLQSEDGVIHDLQIPHPDAWAVNRNKMLSVFNGSRGRVFFLRTGVSLDVPANPNHYVGDRKVLDRTGRPYMVGMNWVI